MQYDKINNQSEPKKKKKKKKNNLKHNEIASI